MRYEQAIEGEWIDWNWKNNNFRCCDCHLIHIIDFRIRKGRIETRFRLAPKLTYAARKRAGIKVVIKGRPK